MERIMIKKTIINTICSVVISIVFVICMVKVLKIEIDFVIAAQMGLIGFSCLPLLVGLNYFAISAGTNARAAATTTESSIAGNVRAESLSMVELSLVDVAQERPIEQSSCEKVSGSSGG